MSLTIYSLQLGEEALRKRPENIRKQYGQFLTPAIVARFMARWLGPIQKGDKILDPAIGSGVLACAIIERVIEERGPTEFSIVGYEVDKELYQLATKALERATAQAAQQGITVHTEIYLCDFILDAIPTLQPALLPGADKRYSSPDRLFDHIIANPPYFKLNRDDPRVKTVSGLIKGDTNIYALFMALAIKMLTAKGKACFIVPRSFCSGAYFSKFRQDFIQHAEPLAVHLFESRQDNFREAAVLQENVIIKFQRQHTSATAQPRYLDISVSKNAAKLKSKPIHYRTTIRHFLGEHNNEFFFRLPMGELDEQLIETVDNWTGSLNKYGFNVSTGPVVPFRARSLLRETEAVANKQAVPLLWMQNVKPQQVEWPITQTNKPQGITLLEEARSLLVPSKNYVLLRRFSAKEEARRLIAAPFLAKQYQYPGIGLENHLNYIYRVGGDLEEEETFGLAAFYNCALVDRYFRIVNGNTQINAAELRALPMPPLAIIKHIGQKILSINVLGAPVDIDDVVFSTLREFGHLPPDFPIIRETRITMGKTQQAQDILQQLGLPPAQQNEISALTLLILAQLSEEMPWYEARLKSLRIHDILLEIKERYGREYAENTRETIRRQVIHQFLQAGLVIQNPDDPTLPTNSPRTHYALSDAALKTIQAYQSESWQQATKSFIETRTALLEVYQKRRDQYKVPLRLTTGEVYHLSPGKHNEIQVAVIEEFGPRFAPGAKLLYLGDTENKSLILDTEGFENLGIATPSHDKLPDIVLYDDVRNWLYLIEVVTSHGSVSPKRHLELKEIFEKGSASCIYVSAFPDFATFKNFLTQIAWETEVWLAEIPDHLIHFNGGYFLGPRHLSN